MVGGRGCRGGLVKREREGRDCTLKDWIDTLVLVGA